MLQYMANTYCENQLTDAHIKFAHNYITRFKSQKHLFGNL